jgi:hypothetical protein
MTREEAEKKIAELSGAESVEIVGVVGYAPCGCLTKIRHHLGMSESNTSSSTLRAIADILDQVGKEEVKP